MHRLTRSKRLLVIGTAIVLVAAGCATESSLPTIDTLADGWNQLFPGGETLCSDSSAYTFFVRPASHDSLMIHLQGGGACWQGEHCAPDRDPTYDPTADERDNPSNSSGIWDVGHPENPFSGYSQVLVPYCTGDVHLGDKVTTYDVPATDGLPAGQVTIHHRGYGNAMAVLDWVFRNFDAPRTVFVNGTSAGSIPAAFYAGIVQEHYPDAYVVGLGDASGGYRGGEIDRAWDAWGTLEVFQGHPGYDDITEADLRLERLFAVTAQRQPGVRLAQINSTGDRVQLSYLWMLGVRNTPLLPLLDSNESAIRAVAPSYRSFVYGGADHGLLGRPAFYFLEAGTQRVRDWVADLAAGRDPGNARCTSCGRPSHYFTDTDLRTLERANEILGSPASWHQEDDRQCEDDDANERWSLFCALGRASRDVTGSFTHTGALSEVLRTIEDRDSAGAYRDPIRDFNNAPETGFTDVKELLQTVIAYVRSRLDTS